ncbi:hypothetical protein PM022_08020 [Halorubrum ezzemoulense]|uniref:hypothetical protein n=1 Tax=Halorubrum ezzemoulense TaxID=337243 RepID=UPI00232FDA00|nr:hypothetical protein [Halorubrum ezzemoulense]MDB2274491.1 hypothetical protein [Halorubrum ezzemoulense]
MTGRPADTSDEEILNFFRDSEDLIFSTSEVADALSYSQPGIYRRLVKLEEKGAVESKTLGGTRAWWLSDRERNS